jgi:WD40 repeat protein
MSAPIPDHPKIKLDKSGALLLNFGEYGGEVELACFSPSGARLLMVQEVGTAKIWDVKDGKLAGEISPQSPLAGRTGVGPTTFPFRVFIESAALEAKGEVALLGLNDGTAGLFRVSDGSRLSMFHEPSSPPATTWGLIRAVAFSPDGALAVVGFCRQTTGVWRTKDGSLLGIFRGPRADQRYDDKQGPRPHLASSVGISADNRYLFAGYADMSCTIWDLQTSEVIADLLAHTEKAHPTVARPEFVPAKTLPTALLAVAGAFLWHGPTGRFVHTGDGPRGWVTPISLSNNGKWTIVPLRSGVALIDLSGPVQRLVRILPFEGRLRATQITEDFALAVNSAGKVFRWTFPKSFCGCGTEEHFRWAERSFLS